jgi:hypothetical protein
MFNLGPIMVPSIKAKMSLVGSIAYDISFDGVGGKPNPLVDMC